MADQMNAGSKLQLRSLTSQELQVQPRGAGSENGIPDNRHNGNNWKNKNLSLSSGYSDSESEGDERLRVRSTISRDITQNTGAADSVDLSKLASHAKGLLMSGRDPVSIALDHPPGPRPPPPPGFPHNGRSLPPPGYLHSGGSIPPPPSSRPVPSQRLPGPGPNAFRPPPHPEPMPGFFDSLVRRPPPRKSHPTSIISKIKPGSDPTTLWAESWSDPANFVSYNWRDRLRIGNRRKSESNLDLRCGVDGDSSISHLLPQNGSRRRLVKAWEKAGLQIEPQKRGAITYETGDNQPMRESGGTLGRSMERHLGLDLYDDSVQSMFFTRLLDEMEALRAERDFLEHLLTRPQHVRPPPPQTEAPPPGPQRTSVSHVVPQLKILHRVLCKSPIHGHDQTVFEDMPVRRFQERSQDLAFSAEVVIGNLSHYCSQNPDISFIVFKEYLCVEDKVPQIIWRDFQPRSQSEAEISPRAERLSVVSDLLRKALDHVALCSAPESRSRPQGMPEMAAPYLFLYHHRRLLIHYEKEVSGLIKLNVSALLGFLKSNYDAEYREADAEFSKGVLTEKHIEKLFRPNDIVIENSGGQEMAYVVKDWPEITRTQMRVLCWSWQYDGTFLQRQNKILSVKLPLPEDFTIDKLPFCPISMASDTVIEKLRKRGEKFWSMKDQYFGCYSGLDTRRTLNHHHTRVMIDMFTYSRMHSWRAPAPSMLDISRFDPWPNQISREEEPNDSMILLLPSTVFAFMLQEKTWLKLDVNGIHPIEWNKRAFDRLVLDPKTKELITALVEVRIASGRAEDIIGGKGNGLMILLHGGPGTGKTLTAESVAEIAEKPLYRVTCGDIGTKADDVEKYLETVLYLGKIWNCVLLLDEADVFLEERSIADLERNSLVSVFLRILEYYDGILIMTSNRVGTFDEAFKSRIQVSLHYEDLTKKARRTIWTNFIGMLEEAGEDVNISDLESHLEEMASEEMNGRQIRNSMTTARQLALHRKEKLHWEHLDQVLKTAREFNRYLKNVQGHTDKQWAREQRLR